MIISIFFGYLITWALHRTPIGSAVPTENNQQFFSSRLLGLPFPSGRFYFNQSNGYDTSTMSGCREADRAIGMNISIGHCFSEFKVVGFLVNLIFWTAVICGVLYLLTMGYRKLVKKPTVPAESSNNKTRLDKPKEE